ncbi:MAG: hypothetical protein ABI889_08095 [Gemmatimonadota bacterium]
MRSITSSLRCALVAMLAIALVAARPAMMAAHSMPAMQHGCGMAMPSHHPTNTDHGCSITTEGACCDDCMCACAIGSDVRQPLVVLVATFVHVTPVIAWPAEIVRARHQPALRLPPQLGPPQVARS